MKKVSIFILAMPLACILASCENSYISQIDIYNRSPQSLVDVRISDRKTVRGLGSIEKGKSARFKGHLDGEGGVNISWIENGKKTTIETCYYSKRFPVYGKIEIFSKDNVKHECKTDPQ